MGSTSTNNYNDAEEQQTVEEVTSRHSLARNKATLKSLIHLRAHFRENRPTDLDRHLNGNGCESKGIVTLAEMSPLVNSGGCLARESLCKLLNERFGTISEKSWLAIGNWTYLEYYN